MQLNWISIPSSTMLFFTDSESFNYGSILSRLLVNLRSMAIHRDCPICGVVACMIEGYTCWSGVLYHLSKLQLSAYHKPFFESGFDTKFLFR